MKIYVALFDNKNEITKNTSKTIHKIYFKAKNQKEANKLSRIIKEEFYHKTFYNFLDVRFAFNLEKFTEDISNGQFIEL